MWGTLAAVVAYYVVMFIGDSVGVDSGMCMVLQVLYLSFGQGFTPFCRLTIFHAAAATEMASLAPGVMILG